MNIKPLADRVLILPAPAEEKTAEILTALRRHPLGENAAVIGEVTTDGKVRAVGLFGQSRLLDLPRNEPLPRIC